MAKLNNYMNIKVKASELKKAGILIFGVGFKGFKKIDKDPLINLNELQYEDREKYMLYLSKQEDNQQ